MDGYALTIDPGEHDIGSLTIRAPYKIKLSAGSRVILAAPDVESGQALSRWLAGLAGMPRATFLDGDAVVPKWIGLEGSARFAVRVGSIAINDFKLRQDDCQRRARLAAYVFPEPQQYILGRTVGDEWRYTFAALDMAVKPLDQLEFYGLHHLVDRATLHLSGGEAHKLNIACAVESDAPLIVMDLSAQNLDREFLSQLPQLLDERCGPRIVVIFGIGVGRASFEGFTVLSLGSHGELTYSKESSEKTNSRSWRPGDLVSIVRARSLGGSLCQGRSLSRPGITAPIELNIQKGQVYRLIGPNGSGKTTIGKILAGRLPRSEWKGSLNFDASASVPPAVMTSQYPRRSLISILQSDSHSIFEGAIGSRERPQALSRLKLAAARWACSLGADLVFLDEPTAGVTPDDQLALVELINDNHTTTFILATHDDALSGMGQEIVLRRA